MKAAANLGPGMSSGQISYLESGKRKPSADKIHWYVKHLNANSAHIWTLFRAAGGVKHVRRKPVNRSGDAQKAVTGVAQSDERGFWVLERGLRVNIVNACETVTIETAYIEFTSAGVRDYKASERYIPGKTALEDSERSFGALYGCYVDNVVTDAGGFTSRVLFAEGVARAGRQHHLAYRRQPFKELKEAPIRHVELPLTLANYDTYELAFVGPVPRRIRLYRLSERDKMFVDHGHIEPSPLIFVDPHAERAQGVYAFRFYWDAA